jgi:hypothetical protein
MAESNAFCSFGEATCTPQPTISRVQQHSVINRYLIPWLNFQLKNNCKSGALIDSIISTDADILFQKNCTLCSATSVNDYSASLAVDVFPNPFIDKLHIQFNKHIDSPVIKVDIVQLDGRILFSEIFFSGTNHEQMTLSLNKNLPNGIYFLHAITGSNQSLKKLITQLSLKFPSMTIFFP